MRKPAFIPGLESVRGLAALTVCLFHATAISFKDAPLVDQGSLLSLLFNGYGAVVLFFVLSGYVLRLSLEKKATTASLELVRDYLVARVFRLYPVIFATVASLAWVGWQIHGEYPELGKVARNAVLLEVTMNPPFWTVQVEVFGSLLIILAFLLERRLGIWPVFALTACLIPFAFGASSAITAQELFVAFFHTFLLGYLLAALSPVAIRSPVRAALLLGGAVTVFYLANAIGFVFKQWLLLVTEGGACVIIWVISAHRYGSILQWAPVRMLGGLSYSFYAIHPLGLWVSQAIAEPVEKLHLPYWMAVAMLLASTVAVAIILAIPLRHFVERPGILVGRMLVKAKPSPLG